MALIEFVSDNTDLTAIWGAEAPDIIVTGGFALECEALGQLIQQMRTAKQEVFGEPHIPIKWNMRDMNRALVLHDLMHLQSDLMGEER